MMKKKTESEPEKKIPEKTFENIDNRNNGEEYCHFLLIMYKDAT